MNKKHQDAFNKAYVEVLRSKARTLTLNKKEKRYDVVVPLSVVTKAFKKFINVVEKDLKIGKYKVSKNPTNKAKANKSGSKK
jgi:hypothetical protein